VTGEEIKQLNQRFLHLKSKRRAESNAINIDLIATIPELAINPLTPRFLALLKFKLHKTHIELADFLKVSVL
jgi:hypothetical protein